MSAVLTIEAPEAPAATDGSEGTGLARLRRRRFRPAVIGGGVTGLVTAIGVVAGCLIWQDISVRASQQAAAQSVRAATDTAIAMLSYQPDTVETASAAAAREMTGSFQQEYTRLIEEVVAPGAKQQQISTVVTVPAAASVTANAHHAVVLLFIDQATTIGTGAPTSTASSVRVTVDKVGGRWLVSQFDPV